ncbi:MAG: VWA-like domain-containing protein [Eubacteriales bacterium]|nr:VWA-like domain-containing protein [Eubacteriales bacterium]
MGNRTELEEMGKRILNASRTELFLSMRFLGPALHSLGFIMDLSTASVGTDAVYIRFNPNYLFRLYVTRPRMLNRTYLHILLHCVFRHMFTARDKEDRELWDLACDIAVESIIDGMDYGAVAELTPEHRRRVYDRLEAEIRVLTAERIYQSFLERKRNYLEELQLRAMFAMCDHSFWERMEEEEKEPPENGGEGPGRDPEDAGPRREDPRDPDNGARDSSPEERNEERRKDSGNSRDDRDKERRKKPEDTEKRPGAGDGRDGKNPDDRRDAPERDGRDPAGHERKKRQKQVRHLRALRSAEELENSWKETSKRMEAEILASGREPSQERGSLTRILAISNRRKTDYREYLRKFAILREVASVDPDSFDYGFYNYGLEMYGNLPLIEENEYREVNRIRTLVIAIDTSASCQEVLVQRFLEETAAVLRSIGRFFASCEVHLIECDEHVQQERVIHSPQELEKYASAFHVKGGFGTDFRPVFAYVEEKRRAGEIKDLEGLMYFTDGMGIYPEKPTDYDTAFVFFNDEELDDTKVPDWAIRLYIEGERLKYGGRI